MRLERVAIAAAAIVGTFVAFVAVLVATGMLRAFRIPSAAMEPTLHCPEPDSLCEGKSADHFLSLRWPGWTPSRGDIVVFHTPPLAEVRCGTGGTFVKRVVGLPGERWEERAGIVYIDGKRLREPYIAADRRSPRSYPPVRIPKGRYFLEGDNRNASCDSRAWGTVPKKDLVGRVVAIYWPPGRITIR